MPFAENGCGEEKDHVSRGSKCHGISRNAALYVKFTDRDWLVQEEGSSKAPNGELAGARFLASGNYREKLERAT